LTNKLPFSSWKELDKIGGKLSDDLLPSKIDSALPTWVDDLLFKLIRLNPDDRLQSVEEVIAAIQSSLQQTISENRQSPIEKSTSIKADEGEIKPGHKEGAYLLNTSLDSRH
jgi:serine/threonine protein kinase